MSYILDALRRAESERERGQVPGLHAQPVPVGVGEEPPRRDAQGAAARWRCSSSARRARRTRLVVEQRRHAVA
ncbi:MAG: hypothetical protein U1F67_14180 [Rubrivivax sp.]